MQCHCDIHFIDNKLFSMHVFLGTLIVCLSLADGFRTLATSRSGRTGVGLSMSAAGDGKKKKVKQFQSSAYSSSNNQFYVFVVRLS